jgi:biopolymer transport protein ExbD
MTPLIDCTFLLLTFFMLTSHFASAEKLELDLPKPDHSQAQDRRIPDKVIVNVFVREQGQGLGLRLGPVDVSSVEELSERLGAIARQQPRLQVILRADRQLPYGDVRRVMETIAANNLVRLQVAAELQTGGE